MKINDLRDVANFDSRAKTWTIVLKRSTTQYFMQNIQPLAFVNSKKMIFKFLLCTKRKNL
jgi:hypothetical protein